MERRERFLLFQLPPPLLVVRVIRIQQPEPVTKAPSASVVSCMHAESCMLYKSPRPPMGSWWPGHE